MKYDNFSYWFSDTIVDPNGKTVSDINKGIQRLIPDLIDQLNDLNNNHTRFIPGEDQDGQPDSIAFLKYNNDRLWWYVCLSSCLENPFTEFSHERVLYAYDNSYLTAHATKEVKDSNKKEQQSKIGTVIELN